MQKPFKVTTKLSFKMRDSQQTNRTNGSCRERNLTITSGKLREDFQEEEEVETDEEEIEHHKDQSSPDGATEYMQISKLLRFAKHANQTGTTLALIAIEDMVNSETSKICILKLSGVQLLVNLLKCNDKRCKISSLKLLRKLTTNILLLNDVIKSGGLHFLLNIIKENFEGMKNTTSNQIQMSLAIEVLGNLAKSRRVKRLIHEYGGLALLTPFLIIDSNKYSALLNRQTTLSKTPNSRSRSRPIYLASTVGSQSRKGTITSLNRQSSKYRETSSISAIKHKNIYELENVQLAATVLWECCAKQATVQYLLNSNIVIHLMAILQLQIKEIDLPIMGIINQCCTEKEFRDEALSKDLIYHAIRCAKDESNTKMQILGARTIGKCTEIDEKARDDVRTLAGLYTIIRMIEVGKKKKTNQLNTALYTFWMCLRDNKENCHWLNREGYAKKIMDLIETSHENEVIIFCFGILGEYMGANNKHCQHLLDNGITKLITENLQHTDHQILIAVNQTLSIAAEHKLLREDLISNDTLRLTWTNLKSKQAEVVSSSAKAIYRLIVDPQEIAEMVRSFVGGLELLVKLLQSPYDEIISSVCNVISRVARDYENQTILGDYGITSLLVQLCKSKFKEVQKALSKCIVSYSTTNHFQLSLQDSITNVGSWLESSDATVKYEATHALFKLSNNEDNCILMYKCGVVKHLINLIRCDDENLQEASARCLKNIRKTVMATT